MCTLCLQKQVVLSCNLRPSGFDYYKIEDNLPPSPPTVEQLLSQKTQWKSCLEQQNNSLTHQKIIFYCMNHAASVNQDVFYFVSKFVGRGVTLAQRGHCYSQEEGGHKVGSGHWAVFGRQKIATLTSSVSFTCSTLMPVTGLNPDEAIFILIF